MSEVTAQRVVLPRRTAGHEHPAAGSSAVHRLPAAPKVLAHVTFVLAVVVTPALWFGAFAAYLALLGAVAAVARLRPGAVLRRAAIEIPFVVFAVLLPFVSGGDRRDVLGVSVSESGLVSGWNLLAKGTIGVLASVVLASTTEPRDLLQGLRSLRVPAPLVDIASFMLRYLGVVQGEMHRMRIARESRAFDARHLGHAVVVARGAGALFVRTYERGERVHLAMLARGGGALVPGRPAPVPRRHALAAACLPAAALVVLATGGLWA
jgi:cobalt/nickel transport system permease protein